MDPSVGGALGAKRTLDINGGEHWGLAGILEIFLGVIMAIISWSSLSQLGPWCGWGPGGQLGPQCLQCPRANGILGAIDAHRAHV